MYADKLEPADEVIKRLFDPRYSYKRVYIPKEVKLAYLQHFWIADGRRLLAKTWRVAVL